MTTPLSVGSAASLSQKMPQQTTQPASKEAPHGTYIEHYMAACSRTPPVPHAAMEFLVAAPRRRALTAPRPGVVQRLALLPGELTRSEAWNLTCNALPVLFGAYAEVFATQVATINGRVDVDLFKGLYAGLLFVKEAIPLEEAAFTPRLTWNRQPWTLGGEALTRFLGGDLHECALDLLALTSFAAAPNGRPEMNIQRTYLPASRLSPHVESDKARSEGIVVHYACFKETLLVPAFSVGGGPDAGLLEFQGRLEQDRPALEAALATLGCPPFALVGGQAIRGRGAVLHWSLEQPLRTLGWRERLGEVALRFAANNIIELVRLTMMRGRLPDIPGAVAALETARSVQA